MHLVQQSHQLFFITRPTSVNPRKKDSILYNVIEYIADNISVFSPKRQVGKLRGNVCTLCSHWSQPWCFLFLICTSRDNNPVEVFLSQRKRGSGWSPLDQQGNLMKMSGMSLLEVGRRITDISFLIVGHEKGLGGWMAP